MGRRNRLLTNALGAGTVAVLLAVPGAGAAEPIQGDGPDTMRASPVRVVPGPDGRYHVSAVIAPAHDETAAPEVLAVTVGDTKLPLGSIRYHRASAAVYVVLDDSAAMAERGLTPVANGLMQALAHAVDPHSDRIGAVRFGDEVDVRHGYAEPPSILRRRGLRLAPGGARCVNQAVAAAVNLAIAAPLPARAVVLVASGPDADGSCPGPSSAAIGKHALAEGVDLMVVHLDPQPSEAAILSGLAEASGGRYWALGASESIEGLATQIARRLTARVYVSFQARLKGDAVPLRIAAQIAGREAVAALDLEASDTVPAGAVLVAHNDLSGGPSVAAALGIGGDAGGTGDGPGRGAHAGSSSGGSAAGSLWRTLGTLAAGVAAGALLTRRRRRPSTRSRGARQGRGAQATQATASQAAAVEVAAPASTPRLAVLLAAARRAAKSLGRRRRPSGPAAPAAGAQHPADVWLAPAPDLGTGEDQPTPGTRAGDAPAPGSSPASASTQEPGDAVSPPAPAPDTEVAGPPAMPTPAPPEPDVTRPTPRRNGAQGGRRRSAASSDVGRTRPAPTPITPTGNGAGGPRAPAAPPEEPAPAAPGAPAAAARAIDASPDRTPFPLVGTVCGRYRLEAPLGRGGLGEVYRARDLQFDRTVAVKVLYDDMFGGADAFDSLMREVSLVDRITHPNVVRVYDVIRFEGSVAIVMEYVHGRSLSTWARERGTMKPEEFAPILAGVAEALDAAHAAGVVHGDVTPGNVLITEDGKIKLCDFGVGRLVGDDPLAPRAGTPRFVAPEVLDGQDARPRADVYSLGALTLMMLAGRDQGIDALAPPFAAVLEGALEPEPNMRCASAGALAVAFRTAMAEEELRRRGPARKLLDAVRRRFRDRGDREPAVVAVPPTVTFPLLDREASYVAEDPDRTQPLPPVPAGDSAAALHHPVAPDVTQTIPPSGAES